MSRWRRQQRKRAGRALLRLRWRAAIVAEAIRRSNEHCREQLRAWISLPRLSEQGSDMCSEAIRKALEGYAPSTTFDVKVREGATPRSLLVDVTVRDPSPGLAAKLLAAGGRWVER